MNLLWWWLLSIKNAKNIQEFFFIIKDNFTSKASRRPDRIHAICTLMSCLPCITWRHIFNMVVVRCPAPGCTYEADNTDSGIVTALLNIHALEQSRAPVSAPSSFSGPKLNRLSIDAGVDEEAWNAFIRRWETFKNGSRITDDAAPSQFFSMC